MTLYESVESRGYLSLSSMEGLADFGQPVVVDGSRWRVAPGVLLATLIVGLAYLLHKAPFVPFTVDSESMPHPLGVSILAIVMGMTVASFVRLPKWLTVGCRWAASWFIPVAIVCLGVRVDFAYLVTAGPGLIAVVVGLMAFAIGICYVLGKCFGLSLKSSYLLGIGTAVCGGSAILAVAPVCGANDDDVVFSVWAVNLIGLLAMFTCVGVLYCFPELSAEIYGAWAGASIHAVPQVVAAGASHGELAAAMATMVKLMRVSMLAPVVILSALWFAKRSQGEKKAPKPFHKYIPWFVWGFVGVAVLASFGWIPNLQFASGGGEQLVETEHGLATISKYLLAVAMAAIGLQVNVKSMLKSGGKTLMVGVIAWLAFTALAFGLLWLLF